MAARLAHTKRNRTRDAGGAVNKVRVVDSGKGIWVVMKTIEIVVMLVGNVIAISMVTSDSTMLVRPADHQFSQRLRSPLQERDRVAGKATTTG
ncbi:hypothetical protein Tco_0497784 [Tanacetum coccineum]|uniref:Uncharacterized protein n=1 Tax=Tanacetum coccineum TaxID=301880 RepID=A0ABQ5BQG8_9ASTR